MFNVLSDNIFKAGLLGLKYCSRKMLTEGFWNPDRHSNYEPESQILILDEKYV